MLESVNVDGHARLTVALIQHLTRRPRPTAAYRSLRGHRILVVDDDAETLDLIRTVLQSAGATVMQARSRPDGLAHLRVAWPDALLADLSMPRDDGYSLMRQARALADLSGRRLTAAAFTALGAGEQAKALRAGLATLVTSRFSCMRSRTLSRTWSTAQRNSPAI